MATKHGADAQGVPTVQAWTTAWNEVYDAMRAFEEVQRIATEATADAGRALNDAVTKFETAGDAGIWLAALTRLSNDQWTHWMRMSTLLTGQALKTRERMLAHLLVPTAPTDGIDADIDGEARRYADAPLTLALNTQRAWVEMARQWSDALRQGPIPS